MGSSSSQQSKVYLKGDGAVPSPEYPTEWPLFASQLFIASDHAGFAIKQQIVKKLAPIYQISDLGTNSDSSCAYPVYAKELCRQVLATHQAMGILLCGTGIGVSMVANRYFGIRAARCMSAEDALFARSHNDANVICLAARQTPVKIIYEMLKAFLSVPCAEGRHRERLNLFS